MSTTSTGSSSPRRRAAIPGERPLTPERASDVPLILQRLGIRPSRALGQSFLHDPFVADAEVALVGQAGAHGLLEIGPGLGILTRALQRRGIGPIVAIEQDARLAAYLRSTLGGTVRVIEGDALTAAWPEVDAVTGNLPFASATPLVLRWLRLRRGRGVFLLQKEVAERLAATEGSRRYGRLSIIAALYGEVTLHQVVPARSFTPSPQVDGQLVQIDARPGPLAVPSVPELERLVQRLFAGRRKQLKNLLPGALPPELDAGALARGAGWPEEWAHLRPEALPPEAYFRLSTEVARQRIS